MGTFSQVVDELVLEHLRPDLRVSIASYLNQTIREVHSARNSSAPILFGSNRYEDEFLVESTPAVWPIPSVPRFQRLEKAFYVERDIESREKDLTKIHVDMVAPNRDVYWYRTGQGIAFSGVHVGETIRLSYFQFPRSLKYYEATNRPAVYDEETDDFSYHESVQTPEQVESALELTTNWLLLRWKEVLKQGVRTKIYVRLGDELRGRMSFSTYESQREMLQAAEQWQQGSM